MTRDHLQPLLDNATQKIVKGLDKVVCALNGGPTTSGRSHRFNLPIF